MIILVIGLILVGVISTIWIRQSTLDKRLDFMKAIGDEVAERVVSQEGDRIHVAPAIRQSIENRQKVFEFTTPLRVMVVDMNGDVLFFADPKPHRGRGYVPEALLESNERYEQVSMNGENLYLVKSDITINDQTAGYVFVGQDKDDLVTVQREYGLLIVLLLSIGVLGWGVIYMLTKQLSRPVQQVAEAARSIEVGVYTVDLPEDQREKELSELVSSFKEMTSRLEQLENLRTELLASVTHEFKTPVTSISGLLQAVKEDVVEGDDAKEFVDISYQEAQRLKGMVEDLLDFNAFVTGAMNVTCEEHNLPRLVGEIVHQWEMTHKEDKTKLAMNVPEEDLLVLVDSHRLYQMMTNLLNNAQQAIEGDGVITVEVREDKELVAVRIRDTGSGISYEEQAFIFERFYRGEKKKNRHRGLGIGLSFSKMLAQSQGGDLDLLESSSEGTTFEITLEKSEKGGRG